MLNNFNTERENLKVSYEGGFFIARRVKERVAGDFCDTINCTFSEKLTLAELMFDVAS